MRTVLLRSLTLEFTPKPVERGFALSEGRLGALAHALATLPQRQLGSQFSDRRLMRLARLIRSLICACAIRLLALLELTIPRDQFVNLSAKRCVLLLGGL